MEDPLYREIILEHWQNPNNYGILAKPTITADGYNPLCGDKIHLTAIIKDDVVVEVAFTAEGCAIASASASLFTDYIKGMTVKDVKNITDQEVLDQLGVTLTPARQKCALLIYKTFQKTNGND